MTTETVVKGYLTKEILIDILQKLPSGTEIWIVAESQDINNPEMILTMEGNPTFIGFNAETKRLDIVLSDDPNFFPNSGNKTH